MDRDNETGTAIGRVLTKFHVLLPGLVEIVRENPLVPARVDHFLRVVPEEGTYIVGNFKKLHVRRMDRFELGGSRCWVVSHVGDWLGLNRLANREEGSLGPVVAHFWFVVFACDVHDLNANA